MVSTSREAGSASRCVWASGRRSCRLQNKLVSVQRVLRKTACVLTPNRLLQVPTPVMVQGIVDRLDMNGQDPVTPMTALVVDDEGRLTYMGEDGRRRVIVGDQEILDRLQALRAETDDTTFEGGCGI